MEEINMGHKRLMFIMLTAVLLCESFSSGSYSNVVSKEEVNFTNYKYDTETEICNLNSEIDFLKKEVSNLESEIGSIRKELLELKEKKKSFMFVEMTAYTACKKECGNNPFQTATGTKTKPGRTAAVSNDLKHLMGKEIIVDGVPGTWIIEDIMHPKWHACVDLLFKDRKSAINFGRRKNVKITIL
jgi:3D (Asp-Asp-Asp) domain-containing protein